MIHFVNNNFSEMETFKKGPKFWKRDFQSKKGTTFLTFQIKIPFKGQNAFWETDLLPLHPYPGAEILFANRGPSTIHVHFIRASIYQRKEN